MVECCENPQKHHSAIFDKYNDKRFKRASHFVETEMRRGFQVLDILDGSGSYPELYEPKKSWSHKWKTVSLISKFSPQARPSNIFIIQTTPYHGLSTGHNSSKSRSMQPMPSISWIHAFGIWLLPILSSTLGEIGAIHPIFFLGIHTLSEA